MPGITAETAIAVAGGFTDRANKRVVRVSRTINGKLYEVAHAGDRADPPGRHDLCSREPVLSGSVGNPKESDKIDSSAAASHLVCAGT